MDKFKSRGDFAKSWDQRSWQFAVESYERWKKIHDTTSVQFAKEYAKKKMDRMIEEYPQLAK